MSEKPKKGNWVRVWGLVVQEDPHPEEVTVRFESHNEHYNCLVKTEHLAPGEEESPPWAPRCASMVEWDHEQFARCKRHSEHGGRHKQPPHEWADRESYGYVEER